MRLRIDKLAKLLTIVICLMLAGLFCLLFLTRVQRTITVYGRLEAANPTFLRAPRDGYVDKIFVEDGAMVQAGDSIMLIVNPADALRCQRLALELDNKRHELDGLRLQMEILNSGAVETSSSREILPQVSTQLERSEKKLRMANALLEKGYLSADEYDQLHTDYELCATSYAAVQRQLVFQQRLLKLQIEHAERQTELLQAEMREVLEDIEHSLILSPSPGYVELGGAPRMLAGRIRQGDVVAVISDPSRLDFVAQLPERHIIDVYPGQEAHVFVTSYEAIKHGFSRAAVSAVRQRPGAPGFEVTANIRQSRLPGSLRPGMTGRARILHPGRQSLLQLLVFWNNNKGGM